MEQGKVERVFLDWAGSPVERGVDWLARQSRRPEMLDLSHIWLLTQTSGAGRRIREGLAQFTNEQGRGCLLPKMSTPSSLIKPESDLIDGLKIASAIEMQAHWMTVMNENNLTQFPDLFPRIPEVLDVAWGMSMSRALIQMRQTLAEANHDCHSVEESRLTEKWAEQDRWMDLARLEALYRKRLQQNGLIDPMDAGRRWVRNPSLPRGIKEVILLGVSGFPDLGRTALFKLMEMGVLVRAVVFCGPGGGGDLFDDMGRPVREAWESRPLPLRDENLHLAYGPEEQARFACDRIRAMNGVDEEKLNLAVLDPEIKEVLIDTGDSDPDLPVFHDPEGISGDHSPLYFWLKAIKELTGNEGMNEAINLLRFPLTVRWLEANGISGDECVWLKELDKIQAKNIPQKLGDGLYFAHRSERSVTGALRRIKELTEGIKSGLFEEEMKNLLRVAFSAITFDRMNPEDLSYIELLPKIGDWLDELSTLTELSFEERFSLLLRMIAQSSWVTDLNGGEIKLNGWLELPWADAPRMIILGSNDAFLPESLPMDSFIPQSLRRELGLWTDEDRSGRDAYLLHWLLASHGESSGVDFVMGKFSGGGSPLKPSPLFFMCELGDVHTLPDRAEKLFGEVPPETQNPAWSYPWKLRPGRHVPVRNMSVTSFRSFLSCPFRFYLKKKFGMEKYNSEKAEADMMDFGTLTHSALEVLGDAGLKDGDERTIFSALKDKLESDVNKRYGRNPGLSILQQKASIERRLSKVAQQRVVENMAGWEILKVEEKFILDTCGSRDPGEWRILDERDDPLQSERSVRIVGMIDRIDINLETGSFRVLDYKTSSKGPEKLHIRGGTVRMEEYPECSKFEEGEKIRRWTDLQLPLYRLWAEKALIQESGQSIGVGIYNLPAKEEEIGISLWADLGDELMGKAMKCTVGVVEDLLDPAEHHPISKVDYDDFEDLFFHSPEEAIERFEK